MYNLEIYPYGKTGRWKWKFLFATRPLALAAYSYASPYAARKAFRNFYSVCECRCFDEIIIAVKK